ncbi:MAG TPA: acyltransferase [Streptosporangiaceae bacterium]|nr:acyltransferase [Streptosporangiaceae bacterium]
MRSSLTGLHLDRRNPGRHAGGGLAAAKTAAATTSAATTAAATTGAAVSVARAGPGRQPALDGLRVIAAFAVLLVHVGGVTGLAFTGTPLSWVVSRGDIGVPIFFTLSGLLLYRPWAAAALDVGGNPATSTYLWRRAVRILPAYWAVVVVAFATLNHASLRSVAHWAEYLGLAQVYDPRPWWGGTGAPGLAQMWSLAVEVSFYALLPVLAGLLTWYARRAGPDVGRRARRLLAGIAVLTVAPFGLAVLEYYPAFEPWIGETLPRLLTWFTPGMAIAVVTVWAQAEPGTDGPVRRLERTVAQSAGACWLIAVMTFVVACTPVTGPQTLAIASLWQTEIKLALYAIVAAAIVAPAAFQPRSPTRLSMILGNRVMRFLGKVSYGVFLWQYLVIYGLFAALHQRNIFSGGSFTLASATGVLVAVTVLTVAAATMSFYLIENPAQRLYQRLGPRSVKSRRRALANTPKLPPC